ncbi:TetR family transcriptional regulator [Clostridia bacterium]|nr:TetR family transcriptional regulator [Clostridia bacterium]
MSIHRNKGESKRKLAAKATEKRIKQTALELFEEHGFDIVTIEDITSAVGVSKGTFYVYFQSKDEILVNEFKKIDKHYEHAWNDMPKNMPVLEQIEFLFRTVFDYCGNTLGLNIIRVMYNNQISVKASPDVKFLIDKMRILYSILRSVIEAGFSNGEIRSDIDPDSTMNAIRSSYHGILYDWCLYNGSFNLVERGMKQIAILIEGIKAK